MQATKAMVKSKSWLDCLGLWFFVGGKIPLMLNMSTRKTFGKNQRECGSIHLKMLFYPREAWRVECAHSNSPACKQKKHKKTETHGLFVVCSHNILTLTHSLNVSCMFYQSQKEQIHLTSVLNRDPTGIACGNALFYSSSSSKILQKSSPLSVTD